MPMKKFNPLRNKDTFLGIVLLIASVIYLIGVQRFPPVNVEFRASSPSFLPNLLGVALAVLSIFLTIEGYRSAPAPILNIQASKKNIIRAAVLLAALVLFILFFDILGFAVSAFILTAGLQLLLGEKNIIRTLIVALIVSAVLYVIFVVLLRVSFPVGIFMR